MSVSDKVDGKDAEPTDELENLRDDEQESSFLAYTLKGRDGTGPG